MPGSRSPICAGARGDDAIVGDLRALAVGRDGRLAGITVEFECADAGLARRVERDRVEQEHVTAVEPRVDLGLRLALARAEKKFAAFLEERRPRDVTIDVCDELFAQARDRRGRRVEIAQRRSVLDARPGFDLGIARVLEPAVGIGQLDAVDDVDHRPRRRRRWLEYGRTCRDDAYRAKQCDTRTDASQPCPHEKSLCSINPARFV